MQVDPGRAKRVSAPQHHPSLLARRLTSSMNLSCSLRHTWLRWRRHFRARSTRLEVRLCHGPSLWPLHRVGPRTRSGQRVSSSRTALRPGKGWLRALLQARSMGQVTGDAASVLVREAEPSERVQAWPPARGEAWGSQPPLSGSTCPHRQNQMADTDRCFSNGSLTPLAASSNKTVSGCPTQ